MSANETREAILDTAERLFAERGISVTSVRAITSLAGVNVAALNYHFGSKSHLVDAVYSRRLEPLNRERLQLLEEAESEASPGLPDVEKLLYCLMAPVLHLSLDPARGGEHFMRLMATAYTEPGGFFEAHLMRHFGRIRERFTCAFRRVLPHLSERDVRLRGHCAIGAMVHAARGIPGEPPEKVQDVDYVLEQLIAFCAAGLRNQVGCHEEAVSDAI